MKNRLFLLSFVTIFLLSMSLTANGLTNDQAMKSIVQAQNKALGGNENTLGNWTNVDQFSISLAGNGTNIPIVVNGSVVNGTVTNNTNTGDNNTDTGNNDTNTGDNNTNHKLRIGVFADIDNNPGLTKQAQLMKAHGVEHIIIVGDYNYHDGKAALKQITDAGFTKDQITIAVGNHDTCGDIKAFMGTDSCIKDFYLGDKNIQLITMDGKETGMTCGSDSQFLKVKDMLSQNERTVTLVAIHEPFLTVKSQHPNNGGFDCYNELFKTENVNLVLQGHNHNYQYGKIGNIGYGTFGTGTHDTGSGMYSCGSSPQPIKCITGTNGFTQVDIDSVSKHIEGKFISNADSVVDSWSLN